ncbi:MAG: bifunctional diaminohydroxyphosphoribosylaminopyrimidine deaminase/5-amino-6-(5-phosphoribosylamino)uracil reductase RibD [Thermoanaerobaculia bacterium]
MPSSPDPDVRWLRHALRLAARGRGSVHPNPMVGAVVVRDGEPAGAGFHLRAGEAHAEVGALAAAGERARGATLYVTLEPCAHYGRTPPCVEAILAAGIARVVACHRDPDPRVSGRGFARLHETGVAVEVGRLAADALRLNCNWLVPRQLGRPAVTLKWAMSLDGKIAPASGRSQWISSPAARRWAVRLRDEHEAILVGIGTVLADDPRLDRRGGRAAGPIVRVVLDRRLRTPPGAKLFERPGPVRIYTESADRGREERLVAAGAEVVVLPAVDPDAVLADLYRAGIGSVLVEGGAEVATAFFEAGRYDRVHAVAAARLLGGSAARSPLGGRGRELDEAERLEALEARRIGGDIVMTGWNPACLRELSKNADV